MLIICKLKFRFILYTRENMNKYSFTVYMPSIVSRDKKRDASYIASNKLSDFTSRIDRSDRKLTNLDETCLTNLDKCKRYYTTAQNRESRLKETLQDTRKLIKTSSNISAFSSKRSSSLRYRASHNPTHQHHSAYHHSPDTSTRHTVYVS